MIGTLLVFGWGRPLPELAIYLAWGSVIGSLAQVAVQGDRRGRLSAGGRRLALTEPVREAIRNFGPVVASRGAVQLTAYIDTVIASLLPTGAVTGLTNTQLLYTLPVSLFGISISSAALPSISADAHQDDAREKVRSRVGRQRGAHRVLHGAIGGQLRRARRRARRDAAADGPFHGRRLALRVGDSRGRRPSACVASTTSRLYSASRTTRSATRRRRCDSRSCGS